MITVAAPGKFMSPQSGSKYVIVLEWSGTILCYRQAGDNTMRVRLQNTSTSVLLNIKDQMIYGSRWGSVKNADHLSIVVHSHLLVATLCDATRGVLSSSNLIT